MHYRCLHLYLAIHREKANKNIILEIIEAITVGIKPNNSIGKVDVTAFNGIAIRAN